MSTDASEKTASVAYSRYVLGLLFLVYVFNFVDRQILSILLDDIKAELGVSDSQMGFLTGFAFAVCYTVAGIPIARLADVGNRRTIIAIGLTVWSAMTAASGLAQNFVQLAMARVGVGIGEASGSPPSHSLIADYFPPERRATALSIYNMGINVGILFGLIGGGWISQNYGWRAAFFIVGLPGILLAVIVRTTLREPPRGATEGVVEDEAPLPISQVFAFFWSLRSFRHLAFASGLHAFTGYGFAVWAPPFLYRVHDVGVAERGLYLGLIIGIGGIIGNLIGGAMADKFAKDDPRWYLWIPAGSALLLVPFTVGFLMIDSLQWALVSYVPSVILGAMFLGPVLAVMQSLVVPRMRAMASAVLFFVLNMIGLGLGPWLVGTLNDVLVPQFGDHGIRYSLLLATVMTAWAAVHFVLAARALPADLRAKEQLAG